MDLPVRFPSETEVILEDVPVSILPCSRPAEQMRTLRGLLRSGGHLRRISTRPEWARQYAEEQELLAQRNIREFIARHEPRARTG